MEHLSIVQDTEETEINFTHPLSLRILIPIEELAIRNHYYNLICAMKKIHNGGQESQITGTNSA